MKFMNHLQHLSIIDNSSWICQWLICADTNRLMHLTTWHEITGEQGLRGHPHNWIPETPIAGLFWRFKVKVSTDREEDPKILNCIEHHLSMGNHCLVYVGTHVLNLSFPLLWNGRIKYCNMNECSYPPSEQWSLCEINLVQTERNRPPKFLTFKKMHKNDTIESRGEGCSVDGGLWTDCGIQGNH